MFTLPAHLYRGGTSKCWLFDHETIAPHAPGREALAEVLALAFGAADPRHIDGVGGATSTTAKAAVVRPTPDGPADLEYTFAQVGIGSSKVEFGSNCGNCATAIGLHAVLEGIVAPRGDMTQVRMWNTNSSSMLIAQVETPGGQIVHDGEATVPGVNATGVRVDLVFETPAGSTTGRLLPTNRAVDSLTEPSGTTVRATLVDAGAPAALLMAEDLGLTGSEDLEAMTTQVPRLAALRREAALAMGLATEADPVSHAIPKTGIVGAPSDYTTTTGEPVAAGDYDLSVRMLSMLAPHPAIGLTSAVAVAAALVPGSTVQQASGLATETSTSTLRIGTLAGVIATEVHHAEDGSLRAVSLRRAARRLAQAEIDVPAPAQR